LAKNITGNIPNRIRQSVLINKRIQPVMYIHKGITMVVMVLLHLTTVKPLISKD